MLFFFLAFYQEDDLRNQLHKKVTSCAAQFWAMVPVVGRFLGGKPLEKRTGSRGRYVSSCARVRATYMYDLSTDTQSEQ